jgi:dolichol-phosphate mannosyltransferase
MDFVSVILPTYNEREAIVKNVTHICKVLKDIKFEVVVVDDNSPDGTAEAVRKLNNPKVRVIVRTKDRGLGLSIGRGVEEASGNIVIGMDADGNHDPEDMPNMLKHLRGDTKLVVASRFKGSGGMKGWRMLPTFLFNGMFRLFGLPIWDNTSGYYAIRKADLEKLGLKKIYYGYGDYHLRLVFYAAAAGYKMVEVPTTYQARIGGVSKSKLGKMAIEYTKEAIRLRYGSDTLSSRIAK